jgi:predicted nucleotidyltransferase component of viral defense system
VLTRNQFINIAKDIKAPSLGVLEKDYVIGCFMDGLMRVKAIATTFAFKGGTALRKAYFSDWRYSEDVDFSVLPGFPQAEFPALLERAFASAQEKHGMNFKLKSSHQPNGMIRARIQYRGPLDFPGTLYLDVTFDEPIILKPERRKLLVSFKGSPTPQVLTYRLEELLAEKLRSLIERGKARDFYDVWRLLKEKPDQVDRSTLQDVFLKKCEHKRIAYRGVKQFTAPTKLTEAEPYWERELRQQTSDLPSFRAVIKELKQCLSATGL